MNRKIFVIGGDSGYCNWMQGEIVDKMHQADLVVFTGGSDVSPNLYGEPSHPTTSCDGGRDAREGLQFIDALAMNKKLIGICRGSQFLCVMAGGKLVQDQEMQPYRHDMFTSTVGRIVVSSTHHQAQYPWNLPPDDWELLGCTSRLSSWHHDGKGNEIINAPFPKPEGTEVEVAYYKTINALAIQPHPEHYYASDLSHDKESIKYFQNLLNLHMEGKL